MNRLICICVGLAWAGAALEWIGVAWTKWAGNENAVATVHSAVGAIITAVIVTTVAVGWYAWKRKTV